MNTSPEPSPPPPAVPLNHARKLITALMILHVVFATGFIGFGFFFGTIISQIEKNQADQPRLRTGFETKIGSETSLEKLRFLVLEERSANLRQQENQLATLKAFQDLVTAICTMLGVTLIITFLALRQMRPSFKSQSEVAPAP